MLNIGRARAVRFGSGKGLRLGTGGGSSPLFMAAGARIMTNHDSAFAADANRQVQAYQQFLGVAGWNGWCPQVMLLLTRNTNGRLSFNSTGSTPMNGFTIRKASWMLVPPDAIINPTTGAITAGATAIRNHPMTFDGGAATKIVAAPTSPTTSFVKPDDNDAITVPKGWRVYAQVCISFANATDYYVPLAVSATYQQNADMGERFYQNTVANAALVEAQIGQPFTSNTAATGGPVGFCGFFMKGCPTSLLSRVYKLAGDSIYQGSASPKWMHDGECYGAIKQALNSTDGGGKVFFWDTGTFSDGIEQSSPVVYTEGLSTPSIEWAILRFCDALGNVPFTRTADANGHNNTALGLAGMQSRWNARIAWYRANYGTGKHLQFGISTRVAQSSGLSGLYGTTEADQTVDAGISGAGKSFNDWLAAGAGGMTNFIYVPDFAAIENNQKFKEAGLFSTTSISATTANTSPTVTLAARPEIGMMLVPEAGSNAETPLIVKTVTANGGNWDVTFGLGSGINRNVQLAHPVGSAWKETRAADGEHRSGYQHLLVRDSIIANYKAAALAA